MRILASVVAALTLATPAWAGDLAVTFTTPQGKPVADAVVMAYPTSGARAPRPAGAYRMVQKDMQFQPAVLVVPLGAEVAFPNLDPVRHHVYSFSPAKPFELKLYSRDETRRVRFDKPGVVAIGCNIHDDMSAFIRVVDTAYMAKTGASGVAVIPDLPPGAARLVVWHPYLKAARGEISRDVTIPTSGAQRLALTGELRQPRLRHGAY